MSSDSIRLASLGLGWWSDVLADAVLRAPGVEIASCYSRSEEKRKTFAKKFNCDAANSYEEILNELELNFGYTKKQFQKVAHDN